MREQIMAAIKQARKEGNKGVKGFDQLTNTEINLLIIEGKLEVFTQKYVFNGWKMAEVHLLRKPKK